MLVPRRCASGWTAADQAADQAGAEAMAGALMVAGGECELRER